MNRLKTLFDRSFSNASRGPWGVLPDLQHRHAALTLQKQPRLRAHPAKYRQSDSLLKHRAANHSFAVKSSLLQNVTAILPHGRK